MLSSHGALLMLGNWLPKLGVRGLAPGDMLGLVADTGNLKTASLLNILAHNADLPAVIFSLELGESQMFERIAAISARREIEEIEQTYRAGRTVDWRKSQRFRDVLVYTDSMTMAEIDEEVSRSSAKLGCEPKIVAIDYVQLVNARERGPRYERFSDACESARRLAKKHHCVVIVLSQVARDNNSKDGGVREITIHDAKETGSFENSCSLLLGLWKISKTQMKCRVLKNSLGLAGNTVTMDIRGGTFIIDPAKGSL
jgi:replicative DNA helicase